MTAKIADKEIARLVNELHWGQGKSLRMIEREHGLSNDTIRKRCIKLNIKTKNNKQSIIDSQKHVIRPVGDAHWSKKNPKALARCARDSSARMKANNPIHKSGIAEKAAKTKATRYNKEPTFHESLVIDLFESTGVPFEFQPAISKYIPDFVAYGNVIIEVDGRGHANRKASDLVRDELLCGLGFYVVRINQDSLFNKRAKKPVFRPNKLIGVIEDLVPCGNISSLLPPIECKHRVVVRKPNPFTEVIY